MKPTVFSKSFLTVVLLSSAVSLFAQRALDPEQIGSYPVGVTTMQLDDHCRVDPETGGPRQLLTEIWYPAVDGARGLPPNRFSEFILRGAGEGFIEVAEEGWVAIGKALLSPGSIRPLRILRYATLAFAMARRQLCNRSSQ